MTCHVNVNSSILHCVGSPLACDVIDPKCLTVNWDSLRLRRVGDVVQVEVTTDGSAIDGQISCTVTGISVIYYL